MNLDQKKIERSNYTLFDALAAIGGFFGLVISVFSTVVPYLPTPDVKSDLRQSLFRETKKEDDLTQSHCQKVKAFFLCILLENCQCCSRKSREAKASEEKKEGHLNAEINLISIVKKLRFFDSAVKMLIHPATLNKLQKTSQQQVDYPVTSDEEEEEDGERQVAKTPSFTKAPSPKTKMNSISQAPLALDKVSKID